MSTRDGGVTGTLRGRLFAVVTALIALLVAVSVSTLLVRLEVRAADDRIDHTLAPAQSAVATLTGGFVDLQTGELGYVLTGDRALLQHYRQGLRDTARARAAAGTYLRTDRTARRLLVAVDAAGDSWLTTVARPQIAARAAGRAPTGDQLAASTRSGATLFDAVRERLAALSRYVDGRLTREAGRARAAAGLSNWVTLLALVLAAVVTVATLLVLRRAFTRPLSTLVRQVEDVAAGRLDRAVDVSGPAELAAVAQSVDRMRVRILDDAAAAARTREQLATYAEDDRIARDLHDIVIQRLFGAGMRLESMAARHPAASSATGEVVEEIDRSIRELRTVIFGLTTHRATGGVRERVVAVVRDSERSLGFAPSVQFDGPVDVLTEPEVADHLVPALGEMLTNVARHARASAAQVRLVARSEWLQVVVVDDGVGPPTDLDRGGRGLGNLRQRAEALGGSFALSAAAAGGTVAEWTVPLAGESSLIVVSPTS